MPRRRESVGKALRRALGEEVVLPRIEPRKPGVSHLMNERRLRVFQAVFNDPGVHLRDLQRSLGIPLQSLRWHVSVLTSAGILERVNLGKREALISPITAQQQDVKLRALLRDKKYGPIIRLIAERNEASVKEIEKEIGAYQQLVSARLKLLKGMGIVESTGKGSRTRYRLTATSQTPGCSDPREVKERLVALFTEQGLVPRVLQQSSNKLVLTIDTGIEEKEVEFRF